MKIICINNIMILLEFDKQTLNFVSFYRNVQTILLFSYILIKNKGLLLEFNGFEPIQKTQCFYLKS